MDVLLDLVISQTFPGLNPITCATGSNLEISGNSFLSFILYFNITSLISLFVITRCGGTKIWSKILNCSLFIF